MKCCVNCGYARKSCNDEYVGCIAMIKKDRDHCEEINKAFDFYEKNSIATGWVYLGQEPNEIIPENKLSLYEGLMTNGIVCFKKSDCCKHWRPRDNY